MMHLDVPTLMVMGSLVAASAGAVLLVAWLQNRKISILALWGLADIATAGGVFSLMLGSALRQPLVTALGGSLLVLAQGLIWKAVRTFDAKPAPLVLALLGMVIVGLASAIPGLRNISGSLGLALSSVYLFAAATALWLGRKERLAARWPIMAFTGVHAAILLIGAYSTFGTYNAYDQVPPLISLFGFIHFENNIFVLATAVFILALVKERSEAASRMAAQTDPLTGIANRSAFMDSAERVVERCRRDSAPVSVIMFDLDRFKTVNDTHGHAVGDAVIRKFCEVTAAALWPSDVFGRIGGEEFAVVLPGSSIEAAYVRADRICASFAENCRFVGDHQVNTTVSGGVSISVNGEQTLSMLLEYSDIALYRAKTEGRNRVKRADQPKLEGDLSTVLRVA
jgi:diguanylate cyclase (GGDEF)-like protein